MSVFESILLVFNERATMIQFFVILPIVCTVDWIGCGYRELSWIGLDCVIKLLDWVGLDLAKWMSNCAHALHFIMDARGPPGYTNVLFVSDN